MAGGRRTPNCWEEFLKRHESSKTNILKAKLEGGGSLVKYQSLWETIPVSLDIAAEKCATVEHSSQLSVEEMFYNVVSKLVKQEKKILWHCRLPMNLANESQVKSILLCLEKVGLVQVITSYVGYDRLAVHDVIHDFVQFNRSKLNSYSKEATLILQDTKKQSLRNRRIYRESVDYLTHRLIFLGGLEELRQECLTGQSVISIDFVDELEHKVRRLKNGWGVAMEMAELFARMADYVYNNLRSLSPQEIEGENCNEEGRENFFSILYNFLTFLYQSGDPYMKESSSDHRFQHFMRSVKRIIQVIAPQDLSDLFSKFEESVEIIGRYFSDV